MARAVFARPRIKATRFVFGAMALRNSSCFVMISGPALKA